MNKEAIFDVANLIEQNEHLYDQGSWGEIGYNNGSPGVFGSDYYVSITVGPTCGTPGCIAAWSQYSEKKDKPNFKGLGAFTVNLGLTANSGLHDQVMNYFGLTYDQTEALVFDYWHESWLNVDNANKPLELVEFDEFMEEDEQDGFDKPSSDEAVFVLRRLAEHGFDREEFGRDREEWEKEFLD